MSDKPVLGVALGGGGSRAFVHLGVLARLIEEGLPPARISGSSMGAVLGALFAARPYSPATIPGIVDYFQKSSLFGGLMRPTTGDGLHRRPGWFGRLCRKCATASIASAISFRRGLRRLHPVNAAIDHLFAADSRFETFATPFGANALNLTTGTVEHFTAGPVGPALKAGVAIGLVFAPFEWNGCQYADAAPISPVPVDVCRGLGADAVLAVDISAPLERPQEQASGFDVVRRIMSVQSERLNAIETAEADVVLKIDVADVFWGDFSHIDSLVERGREAAGTVLDQVRAALARQAGETRDNGAGCAS